MDLWIRKNWVKEVFGESKTLLDALFIIVKYIKMAKNLKRGKTKTVS